MKKILITGKNSYIGTSFQKWLKQNEDSYEVDTIDVKNDNWKDESFQNYDVVFHVAGIAHKRETKKNKKLYYKVNRDLSYEIAKKSKLDGVKHFIFLSSMSVYGLNKGKIDKNTIPSPNTNYGKSKLEAEKLIYELNDKFFCISIIRPPMVYGKNCKGNYKRLAKLSMTIPIFPNIDNKRSMIYIYNLCEFIKKIIDTGSNGFFFPQNAEYVNTSNMVKFISKSHGKSMIMTKIFNPVLKILNLFEIRIVNKLFSNLIYEMNMSEYSFNYIVYDFEESIFITEGKNNE